MKRALKRLAELLEKSGISQELKVELNADDQPVEAVFIPDMPVQRKAPEPKKESYGRYKKKRRPLLRSPTWKSEWTMSAWKGIFLRSTTA